MINESKKSNYIEVTPVVPMYCIDDVDVKRVVKHLFEPRGKARSMMVLKYSYGLSEIEYDEDLTVCSTLPLHHDTVSDDFVYELFENYEFNEKATIYELQYWGIDKVYYALDYNSVLSIKEFLSRVKENFVDKNKSYFDATVEDKDRIFEK